MYFYTLFSILFLTSFAFAETQGLNPVIENRDEKIEALFKELKIPSDTYKKSNLENFLAPFISTQTRTHFEEQLATLDPSHQLERYLKWNDSGVTLYRDRDTRRKEDITIPFLSVRGTPKDPTHFVHRLKSLLEKNKHSKRKPLLGLRVAIDPGHMAGPKWDSISKKFVDITNLGRVSEGELTLLTSLALADRLEKLGAVVLLTRKDLNPAYTKTNFESFDATPFMKEELRQSTEKDWWDEFLSESNSLAPENIKESFLKRKEVQDIFSNNSDLKAVYFSNRADLNARAELINEFDPDLVLILHFDARERDKIQNEQNVVRAYIEGNVMANETATLDIRATLLRHLFDAHRNYQSSMFAAHIVSSLSEKTGIQPLDTEKDFGSFRISDGIYARNLAITRKIYKGATAFVEILRYDYESEFKQFLVKDASAKYRNKNYKLPSRLLNVVDGLEAGVLSYVNNL